MWRRPSTRSRLVKSSIVWTSSAIIHCPIGKKSFTAEQLTANLNALMGAINRAKPAAAKGVYLRSVVLSSTMGPGIKVNPLKF